MRQTKRDDALSLRLRDGPPRKQNGTPKQAMLPGLCQRVRSSAAVIHRSIQPRTNSWWASTSSMRSCFWGPGSWL